MVTMAQRLDARSFFFHPQLSVSTSLALILKVCRNRFIRHGQSLAEVSPSKLMGPGKTVRRCFTATCYFLDLARLALTGFVGFAGASFAARILPTRIAWVNSSKSSVLWSA